MYCKHFIWMKKRKKEKEAERRGYGGKVRKGGRGKKDVEKGKGTEWAGILGKTKKVFKKK